MKIGAPLFVGFLAASVLRVSAETSTEALLKFQVAAEKELETIETRAADGRDGRNLTRSGRKLLSNIEIFATSGKESTRLDQALNEVNAAFTSDEVHKAAKNLGAIAKKERDAKQNAELADLNAALKRAIDAVATARTVQDLDEPLKSITRFVNRPVPQWLGEGLQEGLLKMRRVSVFLQRWQEFLAAKNSGNAVLARKLLQNMSGDDSTDFVPRSQILAEIAKFPDEVKTSDSIRANVEGILRKAKTLDDLAEVTRQLREIRNWPGDGLSYQMSQSWAGTLTALERVEQAYHEFKAGLPPKLDAGYGNYQLEEGASATVAALRAQLLLSILPRYLGLPPDQGAKSAETVHTFLERLNADARARGDANLLSRVKGAQRQLSGDAYRGEKLRDDLAWEAYTTAQNQETAGQFMLAVVSYQKALTAEVGAIPVKLVADKLAVLQSAHPREYEAGVKEFLGTTNR